MISGGRSIGPSSFGRGWRGAFGVFFAGFRFFFAMCGSGSRSEGGANPELYRPDEMRAGCGGEFGRVTVVGHPDMLASARPPVGTEAHRIHHKGTKSTKTATKKSCDD